MNADKKEIYEILTQQEDASQSSRNLRGKYHFVQFCCETFFTIGDKKNTKLDRQEV